MEYLWILTQQMPTRGCEHIRLTTAIRRIVLLRMPQGLLVLSSVHAFAARSSAVLAFGLGADLVVPAKHVPLVTLAEDEWYSTMLSCLSNIQKRICKCLPKLSMLLAKKATGSIPVMMAAFPLCNLHSDTTFLANAKSYCSNSYWLYAEE